MVGEVPGDRRKVKVVTAASLCHVISWVGKSQVAGGVKGKMAQ